MSVESKWQLIDEDESGSTHRRKVPGSYLYRTTVSGTDSTAVAVALVFVPEQKKTIKLRR